MSVTPPRLIALDIDGTLLTSRKAISSRNRAALQETSRRGIKLALVTGRRHPAARRVATDLGLPASLILHNGGLVVEGGEVVRCRPLSREAARDAIALGRAHGAEPVAHVGRNGEGRLLVEGGCGSNGSLARYLDTSSPDVSTVDDLAAALADDPIQVMFAGDVEEMAGFYAVLMRALAGRAAVARTVYKHLGCTFLDVIEPGVSKGEALGYLCSRAAIDLSEVLAIGDNWNDVEMLRAAGRAFVMGNSDPELLAGGWPALPTNDEDGVAVALEAHALA